MTSPRPYRARLPEAEALAEVDRQSGRQFDPRAVAALQALSRVGALPDRLGARPEDRAPRGSDEAAQAAGAGFGLMMAGPRGGNAGPPRERFITIQESHIPRPAKTKTM